MCTVARPGLRKGSESARLFTSVDGSQPAVTCESLHRTSELGMNSTHAKFQNTNVNHRQRALSTATAQRTSLEQGRVAELEGGCPQRR